MIPHKCYFSWLAWLDSPMHASKIGCILVYTPIAHFIEQDVSVRPRLGIIAFMEMVANLYSDAFLWHLTWPKENILQTKLHFRQNNQHQCSQVCPCYYQLLHHLPPWGCLLLMVQMILILFCSTLLTIRWANQKVARRPWLVEHWPGFLPFIHELLFRHKCQMD